MEGKNEKRPPDPGHGSGAVDSILNMPPSHTDPNGSYTGRPQDPDEVPVPGRGRPLTRRNKQMNPFELKPAKVEDGLWDWKTLYPQAL